MKAKVRARPPMLTPDAGDVQWQDSRPVSGLRRFDLSYRLRFGGFTRSWRAALTRTPMDRYHRPLPMHLMTDI